MMLAWVFLLLYFRSVEICFQFSVKWLEGEERLV